MKKSARILWGVCLLALGLILLGNSLGLLSVNLFFKGWWTLFIIIPSFYGLFAKDSFSTSLVFLIAGVLLLLKEQKIIKGDINVFTIIIALVIIRVALSFIFKKRNGFKYDGKAIKGHKSNSAAAVAVFSGREERYSEKVSALPDAVAVFGGVDIDLRDAVFENDVCLNATAIFGGIDIIVPNNINVVCNGTGIFGGCENARKTGSSSQHTLSVEYTAVFGGIDVK